MAAPDWLERYRAGDRDRVWHELRQCGARLEETEQAVAAAVCDEMARRARSNVETVVARLRSEGYRFHTNDDEREPVEPFRPASEEAPALLGWLEERFGPVPLTVASWLRLVGDVWFVGTHPTWPDAAAADPLVVELEGLRWPGASMREFFAGESEAQAEGSDGEVFVLPVAPDALHKANVSGGPAYGFRLPDGSVDALFVGEVATPFVDHLNAVFAGGGFLGHGDAQPPWELRRRLTEGLLPL
ncbi:hypothetical protein G5V58_17260 [Nocardioides anomalus]|uniref:Uncharacterized protein n=1 Tax=Nocardioides anomalus TaxID=2712223 RepID=A0A6G6WG18_9ACTN|nr:hypothetical protein [Nocardioides anomalus]QIG44291.1 hypothetical protein G5V58_17260 [Nocardioides anomalus]